MECQVTICTTILFVIIVFTLAFFSFTYNFKCGMFVCTDIVVEENGTYLIKGYNCTKKIEESWESNNEEVLDKVKVGNFYWLNKQGFFGKNNLTKIELEDAMAILKLYEE